MVNSKLVRGYGTLAGLGFIGAALFAVPSTLLLEPVPPASSYLLTVAGVLSGFLCIALPWERMDVRWLHVAGVVATIEAAGAVAVFGMPYVAFFFLVAVSVAYVSPDPRHVAGHLALIGLALIGPVAYGPGSDRVTLQLALVVFPLLALTTGIFAYLRMRMVADHRSYRLFAEETLALATRIAGRPVGGAEVPPQSSRIITVTARLSVPARVAAAFAVILSVPLLGAGLAAAGVKLPGFATVSFDSFGIELPNQEEQRRVLMPGNATMGGPPPRDESGSATGQASGEAPRADRKRGERESTGSASEEGEAMEPSGEAPSAQGSGPSGPSGPDGPSSEAAAPPPPRNPVTPPAGPIGDAVDNTIATLDDLLKLVETEEESQGGKKPEPPG